MNKTQLKLFDYYIPFTNMPIRYDFEITTSYRYKPYPPLDVFNDYCKNHRGDFKSQLCGFLNDKLTIEFKIWWLLRNKNCSDQKLADKTHASQQQINYFKTGKRKIRNMTLKLAENLALEYNGIVNKQLL